MQSVQDTDIVKLFSNLNIDEPTLNASCWDIFFTMAKKYGTYPSLLLSDPEVPEIIFHETPHGFTILNLSVCVGLVPLDLHLVEKACDTASRYLNKPLAIGTFYTLDKKRSYYAKYLHSPAVRLAGADYESYLCTLNHARRNKILKSKKFFQYERIYDLSDAEVDEIVKINQQNSGGRTMSDYLYSTNFLLFSCAALATYGKSKEVIAIRITHGQEVVAYMFSLRVKDVMAGNAMATKKANYVGVFGMDSLILESCAEGYTFFDPNVVNLAKDLDITKNPSTMYKRVSCNSELEFPTYYIDTRFSTAQLLESNVQLPFCSKEGWTK